RHARERRFEGGREVVGERAHVAGGEPGAEIEREAHRIGVARHIARVEPRGRSGGSRQGRRDSKQQGKDESAHRSSQGATYTSGEHDARKERSYAAARNSIRASWRRGSRGRRRRAWSS